METKQIRTLKADEIECKVQTNQQGAVVLALYKDARVDMRLLDEHFGRMNWKRSHEIINGNLFCTISVWDEDKKGWVGKQDVGTESNVEKEKGEASDSFKRAGFNWGIGRELYTVPFIYIKLNEDELLNGKIKSTVKFSVKHIDYNDNREISSLIIVDRKGNVRFSMNPPKPQPKPQPQVTPQQAAKITWDFLESNEVALNHYLKVQKVSDIADLDLVKVYNNLKSNNKI